MSDSEFVRPRRAAEMFGVSERTLQRWAQAGLIGHSRIGRVLLYRTSDIADLLASGATSRTVVPISAKSGTAVADDWLSDPFWARS